MKGGHFVIVLGYLFSLLYGAFCICLAYLGKRFGIDKKYTRKTVHVLIGFEWVILNHFFGPSLHFLIVALAFTVLLAVAYARKMLSVISSDSDNSPGTVYYGISMSVMALISLLIPEFIYPFGIAVFATSFGDGSAGVVGALIIKNNPKIHGNKTLFGTLSCAILSFLSAVIVNGVFSLGISLPEAIFIGIFASGLELIGKKGSDNIILPLGVSVFSYFVIAADLSGYILPLLLTPFIIVICLEKKLLTKEGVIAALILDLAVSISLGNFGFLYLLAFLALTAVVDKVKKKVNGKASLESDVRGASQVLANGAVPMLLALFYLAVPSSALVIAYTAALAECFADSCASGVGVLSPRAYDIIRMKKIQQGLSGGVSLHGTLAALIAAALLPLIAVAFGVISWWGYLIASAVAFLGSLIDSILGSLLQVKYKCKKCGAITEKAEHCGAACPKAFGISFMDNDMVNVTSVCISAILAFAIALLI